MANLFSRIGNSVANLGQGNSLFGNQADINTLRQTDPEKFNLVKQQGMQRLLDTVSMMNARGSGDAQRVAQASNQIRQRKIDQEAQADKMRKRQLETDLSEAIKSGDTNKAYAISAQLNPGSVAQGIAQGQVRPKDLTPQVSADGTMITYYDQDENGNITPRVEVNQEMVDANIDAQRRINESKPLPAAAFEKEQGNKNALKDFNYQNTLIDGFIKNINDGALEFGTFEGVQDFFGNLGIGVPEGSDSEAKLINKNAFENWKQSYVKTTLNQAKGPQTDNDARLALKQIEMAKTPAAVIAGLQRLKMANDNEIAFNSSAIQNRRANFQKSPIDLGGDVEFRIIQPGQ